MTFHHERRLDRALYHMESLEAEVEAWLADVPYRTWTGLDVDTNYELLWVEVTKQPPAELSLIVGDCVHNLRAALDNLVLELAVSWNDGGVPRGVERNSAFPIFSDGSDANLRRLDNMLRGIRPGAKEIIRSNQPYTRPDIATAHPLWWLRQLSNIDKHRLPHVVLFVPSSILFALEGAAAIDNEPIWGPAERRAPIVRYRVTDPDGEPDEGARADFQPHFSVAFGRHTPREVSRVPVNQVLGTIHGYIANGLLPWLTPYLVRP